MEGSQVNKRIVIEFIGGFKDGDCLRSDSEDPEEVKSALSYYLVFSKQGTIGKRFRAISDARWNELEDIVEVTDAGPVLMRAPIAGMNHVYEVVDRIEDDDRILVRYQYKGVENRSPS